MSRAHRYFRIPNPVSRSVCMLLAIATLVVTCSDTTGPKEEDFWEQTNLPPDGNVHALAINSSGDIFAGTFLGVFRSTDNGDNWRQTSCCADVFSLAITSTGHIFAESAGIGVFRSTDSGDTWTNTGLTNLDVISLAVDSTGHIFAGTSLGLFRSTDNGDNWKQTPCCADFFVTSFAINSTGHIFAMTRGGFFRSVESTTM